MWFARSSGANIEFPTEQLGNVCLQRAMKNAKHEIININSKYGKRRVIDELWHGTHAEQ